MRQFFRLLAVVLVGAVVLQLCPRASAQVTVDPSNRYYRNTANQAAFLIGYYDWAAVPDGFFIDQPSRYADMINQDAPYKINYIRISLGVNRHTASTNPPSWNGQPTPVPFTYNGSGLADLNTWDSTFWVGLRNQCSLAASNNTIVHIAFFDGVEIRSQGGAAYGYSNSFWKPSNQAASFYSNPDFNSNGQIDDGGEFYQTTNFNNDTGLGHYQRLLIAKAISETVMFNNVMFEVGNELLASDSTWYTAVITYAKTLTSRPVTQNQGGAASNKNGWSQHIADTPAQVKSNVAGIVGQGYPAWEDPDGPALSDDNVSPDDLRRAAWYSFAGGAAAWGGFTVDFWLQTFNATKTSYYQNLINFITLGGVKFASMTPQNSLVSSNSVNSCLASVGSEYVAYILNGASATLTLTGISGQIRARLFDCKLGQYTAEQTLNGGGSPTFNKPAGADDWAIHVRAAGVSPKIDLGTVSVPDGIMHPQVGDGNTSPISIGGRDARKNTNPAVDGFFYFAVDDGWAFQGSTTNITFTFDYYDTGTGSIILTYDATSAAYKDASPTITLGNTNTWKQAVVSVTDAYFGNRENNGSDFRIWAGGGTRYIDTVRVAVSNVPTFKNSGFEDGFATTGGGYNGSSGINWTPYIYTGVASDFTFADETGAGNFDAGAHSQKITSASGKEGGLYGQFDTVSGLTYTVTVRCKSGSPAGWLWFGINTSGGTDPHESSGTFYPANSSTTSWKTFTWTGQATGSKITLFLDTYNGVGYWDTTTPASTSYYTNSSFENGFSAAGGSFNGSVGTGWTPYVYGGVQADLTYSDETGSGNFDLGAHSQKITAGAGKEGGVFNQFNVVNGQTYNVTVRVKSGSPAGWCFFGINTSGGTDSHEGSGTFYPANNNRNTSWQTFSWTGQATGSKITVFLDTYDGVAYWDTATPAISVTTLSNSTFAGSADGWNIVLWHAGTFADGTMAFESGTGNPAGDMLSGGSGGSNNTDSCTREGGEINKVISTAGYNTLIQLQYDLRFNTDMNAGSGAACTGGCTSTVLEGDCSDKIAVYYSTAGTGGPWTLVEQVYASSMTQGLWTTRTINLPSATRNQANFALRFRFQFNTTPTDSGRLDNIRVIGTP